MENLEITNIIQDLEINNNIQNNESFNYNQNDSSIIKAQIKRKKNLINKNIQKDEQIKLLIDNIINKDLERIEEKTN